MASRHWAKLQLPVGPRNRRRLAIVAGGIAAVIIAVVAAVLLTRPTTHPGHALSTPRSQCVPHPDGTCNVTFGGITFGMSPQQVQRLLGKPATKQGRCWQYPQQVDKYLAAYGVVKSDQAVCFFAGRLSDTSEQDYVRRHGKLVPWHPPAPKLP